MTTTSVTSTIPSLVVTTTAAISSRTFRCAGRTYDCRLDDPFDADIAGIGVIVSFLATAVATFGAIIYGYVRRILPGVQTNRVDELILGTWRREKVKPPRSIFKQKQLEDALEKFILALSDQQLITGFAILLAGFARCDISLYSQYVVAALGWFSCTTHLATLVVLRRYLCSHGAIKTIRVVGMVLVAALLIPHQILGNITLDENEICFYCKLYMGDAGGIDPFVAMQLIFIFMYLIGSYIERVASLYASTGPSDQPSVLDVLAGQREQPLQIRERALKRMVDNIQNRGGGAFVDFPYRTLLVIREVGESFLATISGIMFMASYGITQIVMAWIRGTPDTAMGFGQMVPLLLLFLPVLAVIEIAGEVPAKVHREDIEMEDLCESPSSLSPTSGPAAEHEIPPTAARSSTVEISRAEEGIIRRRTTTQDPVDEHNRATTSNDASVNSVRSPPRLASSSVLPNPTHGDSRQNITGSDLSEIYIAKMYEHSGFRADIIFAGTYMLAAAILGGALCGGALQQVSYQYLQILFNGLLGIYMMSGSITLAYRVMLILSPRLRKGSRASRT